MQIILRPASGVKCGIGDFWHPLAPAPRISGEWRPFREEVTAIPLFFRFALTGGAAIAGLLAWTAPASAHTTGNAFVLLLPTGYYLAGGTLAVALSVVIAYLVPARFWVARLRRRIVVAEMSRLWSPLATSAAGACFLAFLIVAGFWGSTDPRANPLPIFIWSLFWVGFTFLQALFGNLWHFVNPFHAPYRLLVRVTGAGHIAYPNWLGHWPAVAGLLCFGWFELVDLAPEDPPRLAAAILIYWLLTLTGMRLFGGEAWLGRAEPFTLFFRLMASLAVFRREPHDGGRYRITLGWPGARLLDLPPLGFDGICFVLLSLGTVSFDGLSKTFAWLALGGINPLEFPGRSAVVELNTFGLLATWLALLVAYVLACGANRRLAGRLALSIVPIALAYHFAHYLTVLMIDQQYALKVASDPLGLGWNLFGTASLYVTTSFLTSYSSVVMIWNAQAAAIVTGHVIAVVLAQAMQAEEDELGARTHLPLAVLMVLYTLFGLWLMATPVAG